MIIKFIEPNHLAAICAGLVKQGLTFEAEPCGAGLWQIKLTGGF